MKIITLTLAPAFDIHCHGERLLLEHENLVHMDLCQAGGKGVNISRALNRGGVENLALLVLGDENGDSFARSLRADGVAFEAITLPGRIRENITIHVGQKETRISFPGFRAEPWVLEQLEARLLAASDADTVITMTGRIPEGMAVEDVIALLRKAAERGARIVVDSRSFSLENLLNLRPWLIKPNQEEISAYLGREITTLEQTLREAKALHRAGIANVMISMGEEGALLVCDGGAFIAQPPRVEAKSTIGAGDSSIAGFLACGEATGPQRLSMAVAYGTAACMEEGTNPPRSENITGILEQVRLTAL